MRTDRGLDRFVTFLDAVVAIALTLLVLPLADIAGDVDPHKPWSVSLLLHEPDVYKIGSFLLSFLVIARLWLSHHRMVEWVGRYDQAFLVSNLVWAFSVVVLPFPTALIPAADDASHVPAFYIATITVGLLAQSVTVTHVARRPDLQRTVEDPTLEVEPGDRLDAIRDGTLISTGWVVVALAVVLVFPDASYRPMLLLLLSGPTERLLAVVRRRRADRAVAAG